LGIDGNIVDNIEQEPQLGLKARVSVDGVLEFSSKYKGMYFKDTAASPPSTSTYVLWNNGGVLYFGASPLAGNWTDDGSDLKPNTDGYGVKLYNSGGTEYGRVYRDDDYMFVDAGSGAIGTILPGTRAGIGVSSISAPTDQCILEVQNKRGAVSAEEGGRIEQGCGYFEDDFNAQKFKDQWADRVVTGNFTDTPSNTVNGWVRFTTGATTGDEQSKDWDDKFEYLGNFRPTMEVRLKLVDITNCVIHVGMVGSAAGDFVYFDFDTSVSSNWYFSHGRQGVSDGYEDTGVAVSTDEIAIRFEFISSSHVIAYIDNVKVAEVTDVSSLPLAYLQPLLYVKTLENIAKIVDFDYYKTWQDRSV